MSIKNLIKNLKIILIITIVMLSIYNSQIINNNNIDNNNNNSLIFLNNDEPINNNTFDTSIDNINILNLLKEEELENETYTKSSSKETDDTVSGYLLGLGIFDDDIKKCFHHSGKMTDNIKKLRKSFTNMNMKTFADKIRDAIKTFTKSIDELYDYVKECDSEKKYKEILKRIEKITDNKCYKTEVVKNFFKNFDSLNKEINEINKNWDKRTDLDDGTKFGILNEKVFLYSFKSNINSNKSINSYNCGNLKDNNNNNNSVYDKLISIFK